jgi:hypothetical protein
MRGQWEIHRATIVASWQAIQSAVQQTITWFQANIVPPIAAIVAAGIELWNRFGESIKMTFGLIILAAKTFIENMLAPFKIFFALLRGDWDAAWNEIKATVSRTLGAIVTLIKGAIEAWLSAAKALGAAIVDGVVAGLSALGGKVWAEFQKLGAFLFGLAGWVGSMAAAIGSAIVSGIKGAIEAGWDGLKGWFSGKVSELLHPDIPGLSPPRHAAMQTIGEPIVQGIIDGLMKGQPELKASLQKLLGEDIMRALAPSASEGEVTRWAAAVVDDHTALLEELKELWRSYSVLAQNWGRNFGEKIAQGLRDAIPEIIKAAQEVAQAIKDNTKAGSPTKEGPLSTFDMRDAGFDLMAGYAKGVRDGARAIGPSFSGGMASGGGLATAGGGGGVLVPIILQVDGRTIAEIVTRQQFATRRYGGELPSSA